MTEEERKEESAMRQMYAGIALPGLIMKSSSYLRHMDIAQEAFEIAEAMIEESRRIDKLNEEEDEN